MYCTGLIAWNKIVLNNSKVKEEVVKKLLVLPFLGPWNSIKTDFEFRIWIFWLHIKLDYTVHVIKYILFVLRPLKFFLLKLKNSKLGLPYSVYNTAVFKQHNLLSSHIRSEILHRKWAILAHASHRD